MSPLTYMHVHVKTSGPYPGGGSRNSDNLGVCLDHTHLLIEKRTPHPNPGYGPVHVLNTRSRLLITVKLFSCTKALVSVCGHVADSKQMLEKIAQLESERVGLLDEVNEARKENFKVWNSLEEVIQDLNAKEIHLDLLKRDLQMATSEIRSSTELRQENESLRK